MDYIIYCPIININCVTYPYVLRLNYTNLANNFPELKAIKRVIKPLNYNKLPKSKLLDKNLKFPEKLINPIQYMLEKIEKSKN